MQNNKKNNLIFFKQKKNPKLFRELNKYFENDYWVNGKIITKFETSLKQFLNTKKYLCSCNSGTDALKMALLLDGPKKGDIYITTPLSYIASSSIVKFLGLNVIYIDVEKKNYLLDINKLEKFLNGVSKNVKKKIKGIVFVELFGNTTDLSKLNSIAKKHKLTLIGDCAQSLGTKFKGKSTSEYYDYAAYSFYPTKILSAYGDGGMLIIKNKKKYNEALLLKNNGHEINNKNNCKILGFNSRLDSIQAFILNENLKGLKKDIIIKSKIKKYFDLWLPKQIQKPEINQKVNSNNYIYCAYILPKLRKRFLSYMYKNKIKCNIYYEKLLPDNFILKGKIKTNLTSANLTRKSLICFPNQLNYNKKQIKYICNLTRIFFEKN